MGLAARQFRALLWKNWLCRLRHPVLFLAEFLWPCVLFTILIVLRFQEPPRHRDNCYLQPRDLPSQGVFPFVRGLLCNTGSRCRNISYAGSTERHFRSPRFQSTAGHHRKINDLAFLQEMQDLAEEIYEIMDKATNLQKLWVERSKTPDSSYGSGFLTIDLNKTEEVISKLESLHQQPHIWDFLLLLPRLSTNSAHIDDVIRGVVHLLQAVSNSLTSLEDSDWLPLGLTVRRVSEVVLNVTISVLTCLQEHGVASTAFLEESPCYKENMDWKIISDNYFAFLKNFLESPVASISRVLNSTKELLLMGEEVHTLEDEHVDLLVSFVEFLRTLLLCESLHVSRTPRFHNPPALTVTSVNTAPLWVNHLKSLEGEPSGSNTQKPLEFGKEMMEKIQTLERKESRHILRFMELLLFEINPELLELWTDDISKGEGAKAETSSILLNFSVPENERILRESFNFSQLFHSDWPESPAMEMDFVHLSETIINNLYEFGFLRQDQVSKALDTVYAVRNVSDHFLTLSEPQKQEIDKVLTHVYLNVFQDKDSALLLQISSSFYQHIYKFLSIQNTEALLSVLTQISKHSLDIIKQFNFQSISKAFTFLYETTEFLGGISEVSYCQQLLSAFNFVELQAQSLMSAEEPELEVIHATLTGLKQLFTVDKEFRVSLFQYMNHLFNHSAEALLGHECFAMNNKSNSSVNYSVDGGSPFSLLWTQILSNLSTNGSAFNEFMAIHCTVSWLQVWTEIWGSTSQLLKVDVSVFTPLHIGLTLLLDELESAVKMSKTCQGILPTHRLARLILHLFKNVTQADGFPDWDDLLTLRDLWVALGDALVRVKSLGLDQLERPLFTMEAALSQLKAFPFNASAGREGLYSLLELFNALSNTSEYVARNVHFINHFLLNNATHYGAKFESIITNLREKILFLRNMSLDQDLLSCADIFQNVTEFILEEGLLFVNTSQRTLHILAMLNSTFSSEDTISRLKGCVKWVDIINHLHVTYHPSSSQGHLQSALRSFLDVGNKVNFTLKLVTWLLNMMEPGCSLDKSNINCVNIYLRNVTDFLNVILTAVFEKEKVPKFEILLSLLNDSTDQIRMIIHNLTRDFEFASQPNWKHFTESILRPIEISNEIPSQFKNIWLHLIALGKEIQKLAKNIFPNVLGNNSSSEMEKFLNVFATSPKEKARNSLGRSFLHLATYLAFNLSHDLQNSAQINPHAVMKAVGLGIQLIGDAFSSVMPSGHHSSPEGPGKSQALKKVISALRALRKTDVDLLVGQLEQISESLVDFFKNVIRVGTGHLGVNGLVGLVEKVVDSLRSWDVTRLLRLSRLFPRDDVNALVDMSYALPHITRLLRRVVDKNITEALKDIYDFTLLHGMSISSVTREDFTVVIKTLLDTIEFISDKPGILTEALTCLPVLWCWNHTTSGFQQNAKLEACNGHELLSSPFCSKVARILAHLHWSPPDEASQCSNESLQMEITRRMVCVIHELGDWNSILLELSEVFHVKSSLVKTMQEFWQTMLPSVPSSGNQSNGGVSALRPTGPVKQVALQIIEKLKTVNFTNVTSDENVPHKLASLNKILNLNEGTEAFGEKISLNLGMIIKSLSGDQSRDNSTHSLVSPRFTTFLNATLAGSNLEALSRFIQKSKTTYNFEELWLDFEQTMKDLKYDLNTRQLFSEINKDIQMINSVALQNIPLQLTHFLESLNSSSLQALEITKDFLSVTKNWLHKYTKEESLRRTQALFLLKANRSSADDLALLTKAITTYMSYRKTIPREGNFDDVLLAQLVNQEQQTNFSVAQLLLGSFLINLGNDVAGSSQEAAWNLSDTDLQIMNFMDLLVNQTQSEKGERIVLPPGSRVEVTDQLLKTFFSFLQKGHSENRLSLLQKGFPKDTTAEMGFVPKHIVLEILKVDQFLTSMTEDKLMSIFSSLKETLCHLIESSFLLDHGDFSFASHQGLKFLRDLLHELLWETSMKNKTGDNLEFLALMSQLLLHVNSSEDLFKLSHDLQAALHLMRETSAAIANLRDTVLNSFNKEFRGLYPALQQVILANLTDLLFFANRSFPLRNRATLEITKRLLGIVSRAGGESQVREALVEMSATLAMLVSGSAELGDLAMSVRSIGKLLELAKKAARTMVTLSEAHFISGTNDTTKFFDTLYSILKHSVQNVNEITTLKKVDRSVYENVNDLVTPFLDLAFGMIGVKPNISKDSDIFSMSSNIVSYVNESKDFSDILKEIAEFLTSGKINLGDVEHFLIAVHNGTQIFSVDSVNIWEEILDCLVPINDITNQINFLHPNLVSSDSFCQGAHEATPFWGEMLSQNSTELDTYLKMVIDLTLEALWNTLEEDKQDVFHLWLTFAQHPNTLLKALGTVVEVSRGVKGGSGHESGRALVLTPSLSPNAAPGQPEETIRSVLPRTALPRAELLNNSQRANSTRTWFQPVLEVFSNATTGKNIPSGKEEKAEKDVIDSPYILKPLPRFENYLKGLIALTKYWQEGPLTRQSVAEICQGSWQPGKPVAAVAALQRAKMLALHAVLILAESPELTQDVLCAALSCPHSGIRRLLVSGLQGVTVLQDRYQEMKKMWFSPHPPDCEGLSRSLAGALECFRSSLEAASAWDCACRPALDGDPRRVHTLFQNLGKTLFSGNPIMSFLSNFTVTADVKVKDLMRNVTNLTEELRSSVHISDDTINSILEANLSHSQVLASALTVALSGRCDQDVLGLLLAFPEDEASWLAVKELCGLPGAKVYALIVCMSRNLGLRNFIYKTLIPAEASEELGALLGMVSRLSRLLPKAGRVLEHLPEFLHTLRIPALLDTPGFHQASRRGQAQDTAFGSLQSVMKMVCKEQGAFLSGSHAFINLPGVHELVGDDKEKFNIPEDSTPFCLKLYQEILQSPNGALVWSFLKPILHGKILYAPNTPEINKVIRKANYTFFFVDKLKTLSEMLLKVSSVVQGPGNGQLLRRLQKTLRNKFVRSFLESQLHISVDKLTEKLQTYRGVLGRVLSHVGSGRLRFLGGLVANLSSCVLLHRFQGLRSAASLEEKAQELMRRNSFLAGVIFNSSLAGENLRSGSLPPHVTYTIRTSTLHSMRTDVAKNPFWKFHPQSLPADGFKYNYVFVPLQDMIERAVILEQTGQEAAEPAAQVQAAPYPCHRSDLFLNNVGFFFPLIMMLTWMVSVASMVRKLVYEREIQIEEYLRMMGVHPAAHFLAWFLENAAVVTISSAALAVVLRASGIFAQSNAFVVFLFLLDFGVSIVMLSYLLSAFFHQANTAALCASLAYMTSFLPYIVLLVLHNQLSVAIQAFLCLLSTTAFGQGVFFITFLEGQEAGVQWGNMYESPEQVGMAFGWVCWMILFDSGLYFLCGWYLSNLIPGAFGLRRPWYFPVTASYWKDVCGSVVRRWCALCARPVFREGSDSKGSSPQTGKATLEGGPPGVTLVSVTKEYQPRRAAVRDLTLTFPSGQITALLGTNGAGKTSVISMLTGLYPPTAGTIIVNGKNLQTGLAAVRRELGVCPQQDVLFDTLTVWEHLLLFASIKAPQWTWAELQQHVRRTLWDVGLTSHQHKQARALSGGLKRKLSIGIAFLGTSRTVVLDEPTSGVDPRSRHSIWEILLRYREGRTLIFTTHHLDEAEALSDRVAILQHGRLRSWASTSSLVEAYSQGLSLTLSRQPSALEVDDAKATAGATSLIQTYVPRAFLRASSGHELSYTLPKDADRARFGGLFQALEQNLHRLHLTGYGVSDTTLEEVFLMLLQDSPAQSDLAPGPELQPQSHRPPEHRPGCDGASARPPPARGGPLLLAQMAALLSKRLCHTRRAWKGVLSDLLLPVLFVALAMGLFMVRPLAVDYPPLKLTPGHYERAEASFFSLVVEDVASLAPAGIITVFFCSESDDVGLVRVLLREFEDQDLLCSAPNRDLNGSSCWTTDPFSYPKVQGSCACLPCWNGSGRAPYLTNRLGHTLLNLSAFRLEEYLLLPSEKPRLGGWSFGVRIPGPTEDANSSISKPTTLAKVWFNQKAFHSLPSYLNHLNNLILWRLLPPAADWKQYGITLYSQPYGGALLNEDKILESIRQCGVALCIVLGFSILSASIASSVVRDRVTGAKKLQHISGLGYGTYWFTHFLWDMLLYLVSLGLCVAVIAAFQLPAFTFRENLAATALLLALFGYATLPWMYLLSGAFSSSDVAFLCYVSVNFICGLCTMLMTATPRLLAIVSGAQNLQDIYDVLKWAFTVCPQFCLGQGLIELCYNQIQYDLTRGFGIDAYASPFEMRFLRWVFVQLALQGSVLLLLRVLLHRDLVQRRRGHAAIQGTVTSCQDTDVEKEQMRVLKGRTRGDILVLYNLSKSYRSFFKRTPAVQDISVGIRRGECFGLLGLNGAGKSTTFKMLSGDVLPSSGHAVLRTPTGIATLKYLNEDSTRSHTDATVSRNRHARLAHKGIDSKSLRALRGCYFGLKYQFPFKILFIREDVALSPTSLAGLRVGYCPQQDALDPLLTGWEHLCYYCSLHGIPKPRVPQVAGDLVRRLHLAAHVDKPVATYSGGTKRKLSAALALLGKPDLLLLDEPSSGMDPCSKRFLWDAIMQEVREGCSVVLTSHSMEECEVLCTRLAIMVDGSFRCLGSPQHIKNRFGDGYTVKVWLCEEGSHHSAVSDCLTLHFPGAQFKGQRLNLLEYHVPKRWASLADLFRVLEDNKTSLNITHYSVSQTTLEQVFVELAAEQTPPPAGEQPHHLPV